MIGNKKEINYKLYFKKIFLKAYFFFPSLKIKYVSWFYFKQRPWMMADPMNKHSRWSQSSHCHWTQPSLLKTPTHTKAQHSQPCRLGKNSDHIYYLRRGTARRRAHLAAGVCSLLGGSSLSCSPLLSLFSSCCALSHRGETHPACLAP